MRGSPYKSPPKPATALHTGPGHPGQCSGPGLRLGLLLSTSQTCLQPGRPSDEWRPFIHSNASVRTRPTRKVAGLLGHVQSSQDTPLSVTVGRLPPLGCAGPSGSNDPAVPRPRGLSPTWPPAPAPPFLQRFCLHMLVLPAPLEKECQPRGGWGGGSRM